MPTAVKIVLLLVVAIVLALLARAFYVQQNRPAPPADPEVAVRITASALPAGLLLRDEDLAWRTLPRSRVPARALTEASTVQLEGALLRRALPEGAFLTADDILSPQAPGFLSAALRPTMRAVSIPIDEVSGNAGLIRPGDHVDLILTQDLRAQLGATAGGARAIVSETVVDNARVIAVGSQLVATDAASSRAPTSGAPRARTVTLEVPPRAAEAVAVASRMGTLSLALRSFAVTDRAEAPAGSSQVSAWDSDAPAPVWAQDVSRAIDSLPQQPGTTTPMTTRAENPSQPRTITILRGSQAQSTTSTPGSAVTQSSNDASNAAPGVITTQSTGLGQSIHETSQSTLSAITRNLPILNDSR